jgi:hypothetical protein
VESITGNMATVLVVDLDRSIRAEVVDADLKAGATVIVHADAEGNVGTLEATSPWMVQLIVRLKELVP